MLTRHAHSDACQPGWGAACKENSTGRNWTLEESCFHINTLEMPAALYALKTYTRDVFHCQIPLSNQHCQWLTTNHLWNEKYFLLQKNWDYCMGINLRVSASYAKINKNKVADKGSRRLRNNLEWSLKHQSLITLDWFMVL